jgi:hypothetical protein
MAEIITSSHIILYNARCSNNNLLDGVLIV